jgi:signal transduction histidine kinase
VDGGEVHIEIRKTESASSSSEPKLLFRISDTGVGVEDKEAILEKGVGLRNTRLRLLKGFGSQLELLDNEPLGLTVQFVL